MFEHFINTLTILTIVFTPSLILHLILERARQQRRINALRATIRHMHQNQPEPEPTVPPAVAGGDREEPTTSARRTINIGLPYRPSIQTITVGNIRGTIYLN